jgi:hypothetical protein
MRERLVSSGIDGDLVDRTVAAFDDPGAREWTEVGP